MAVITVPQTVSEDHVSTILIPVCGYLLVNILQVELLGC